MCEKLLYSAFNTSAGGLVCQFALHMWMIRNCVYTGNSDEFQITPDSDSGKTWIIMILETRDLFTSQDHVWRQNYTLGNKNVNKRVI